MTSNPPVINDMDVVRNLVKRFKGCLEHSGTDKDFSKAAVLHEEAAIERIAALAAAHPVLVDALRNLVIACAKADSVHELSSEIDGSLIDAARGALESVGAWR